MDLNEILSATLRRGCGIELDELVRSEDFLARVAARTAWFEQLATEDSDLGIAYRAGHLEMGGLLNALPEDMALQYAAAEAAPDPYLSVLLEVMGEELLKAATACLPIQVKGSAALYPGCDADAQLRLINAAYQWLEAAHDEGKALKTKVGSADEEVLLTVTIHKSYGDEEITRAIARDIVSYYANLGHSDNALKVLATISCPLEDPDPVAAQLIANYFLENAAELTQTEWVRQFSEDEYGSAAVLPMEYGKLGASPSVPCCLGMSLILGAFARSTGLPVMLVSPITCNLDYEYIVNKEYGQAVLDHLDVTKSTNASFRQSLQRQVDIAEGTAGRVMDFHYSVAMQVADGRWVHLDPYLNTMGVYSDAWELDRIYALLTKYKNVLPGLTLTSDDGGEVLTWKQKWLDLFDQAIAAAEHTLLAIDQIPFVERPDIEKDFWDPEHRYIMYDVDFAWAHEVLLTSVGLFELVAEVGKLQGKTFDAAYYEFTGRVANSELVKLITAGFENPSDKEFDELVEIFSLRFNTDPEFRHEMSNKLATRFIEWVIRQWSDHVGDPTDRILDPSMQFSLPEYNMGLAVASHVRSWTYPEVPGRLLVGLSSSQFLWHEAVDLSQGDNQSDMDHPDVIRAEATARAQPHQHAACEHKLCYIAGLRQEGTRDGQTKAVSG